MKTIVIYGDWKIIKKVKITEEMEKEINKILVRQLIERKKGRSACV
ncbi:MAG: hypothetical protein ACTSQE_03770 [Candidatus Heimdallarchaeaceae archaeon]